MIPRRRGDRGLRGQATVEVALILPLVLTLALLAVQVALVARAQIMVAHAAREAARAVAIEHDAGAATRTVHQSSRLSAERTDVVVSDAGSDGDVRVRITHRAPTSVPLVGALLGDVTLTAEATMRSEP